MLRNRFIHLRCPCCDIDYGIQSGRMIQQCRCESTICYRCKKCSGCCSCSDGPLIKDRRRKIFCWKCDHTLKGAEKFCPECGTEQLQEE